MKKTTICIINDVAINNAQDLSDVIISNGYDIDSLNGSDILHTLNDMNNSSKHVTVIAGGKSYEREVSLMSATGIVNSLLKQAYEVSFIDLGDDLIDFLSVFKPKIIFNALHGAVGEDGTLPAILNFLNIPYTGSGAVASSVLFDKKFSNSIFKELNINRLKQCFVTKDNPIINIKHPYIIKPIKNGSSIGVEVIEEGTNFNISNYDFPYGDIMVEPYLKGREMQVAVLDGKAIGIIEIELLKDQKIYDYETKYNEGFANHVFNPDLPDEIRNMMFETAEKIYKYVGCKDAIRVEYIYEEKSNNLVILEANTHPGMTGMSIVPEILIKSELKISYDELVARLVTNACCEKA